MRDPLDSWVLRLIDDASRPAERAALAIGPDTCEHAARASGQLCHDAQVTIRHPTRTRSLHLCARHAEAYDADERALEAAGCVRVADGTVYQPLGRAALPEVRIAPVLGLTITMPDGFPPISDAHAASDPGREAFEIAELEASRVIVRGLLGGGP